MKALEVAMETAMENAEEIDSEVVDMMGRFDELTEVEREQVLEQLDGVLSEKVRFRCPMISGQYASRHVAPQHPPPPPPPPPLQFLTTPSSSPGEDEIAEL